MRDFRGARDLKGARDFKGVRAFEGVGDLGSPEGYFGAIHESSLGSLESRGYCRE